MSHARDPRLPAAPSAEAVAATAAVPKAELHVHLEGTARPELVRAIAARNGLTLPLEMLQEDDTFAWTDFLHFLRTYDQAAGVLRTAQDYRDVTLAYLEQCAAEGCVYVELISSPDHARAIGLPEADHQAGIAQGIDDARAAHGIEARVLVALLRGLGPAAAERVVTDTLKLGARYVVGVNVAGDEAGFPPAPFTRAYALAQEGGLGATAHAGEHAGPDSIRGALALPGVTRISHGIRAIEDPDLVAELAARGTVLEVCPTSNVALGVYPTYPEHPLAALRDAGVATTLASDDPPYFGATIGGEYALAHEHMGCDLAALGEITRTALDAAFAPTAVLDALRQRLSSGDPAR